MRRSREVIAADYYRWDYGTHPPSRTVRPPFCAGIATQAAWGGRSISQRKESIGSIGVWRLVCLRSEMTAISRVKRNRVLKVRWDGLVMLSANLFLLKQRLPLDIPAANPGT